MNKAGKSSIIAFVAVILAVSVCGIAYWAGQVNAFDIGPEYQDTGDWCWDSWSCFGGGWGVNPTPTPTPTCKALGEECTNKDQCCSKRCQGLPNNGYCN